ncbi:hypothetical protein Verru16b_00273 [Lacunisphaera limnophila]|uniref:Uncharacterized protein n=2 Tax=Lacunisphaera limnophila TaxID=1838286 RepID=A0A1I7PHY1_9BACT|nr:hypothetical protein Verru16b_00273 [Lacunisphaera limnophila]
MGWALAAVLTAVEVGTPRVNVLQELGTPVSAIKRGDTEVLTYKGGIRISLKQGAVTEVIGLKPAAEATAPAEATEEAAAPEPVEPELSVAEEMALAKEEQAAALADAKARAQLEAAIVQMENPTEAPVALVPSFHLGGFLLELAVKWVMTLVALKLACKYWNSDVPWTGLLLVAGVDVAVRGVIGYIGFAMLDMMTLFYADEAVAAGVMVGLLRKVSINQRLALAIEVVLTTKMFSIVVGSFLVTVLMRTLF